MSLGGQNPPRVGVFYPKNLDDNFCWESGSDGCSLPYMVISLCIVVGISSLQISNKPFIESSFCKNTAVLKLKKSPQDFWKFAC